MDYLVRSKVAPTTDAERKAEAQYIAFAMKQGYSRITHVSTEFTDIIIMRRTLFDVIQNVFKQRREMRKIRHQHKVEQRNRKTYE